MKRQLLSCIHINMKFAWRNRLPVVLGCLFLGMALLTSLPAMFLVTAGKHLFLLRHLVSTLTGFVYWLTGALALMTLSHHLRNRSAKLILTKPCPLEVWLLSNFLSVFAIACGLYLAVLVIGLGLAAIWSLPVQMGLAYVTLNEFCRTMIICSYLTLLTVVCHPVVAVMVTLMLQEGTFYYALLWLSAGLNATEFSAVHPILHTLKYVVQPLYFILPSYAPYAHESETLYASLRIAPGDMARLGYTVLYALCVASLCFWLSDAALRRKRLT